ncbi:MAG: hypothetical protein IT201_08355 [Thermoleophilia bacterium]|nr:hypothetical protein [Thermoleophilia bacterium]
MTRSAYAADLLDRVRAHGFAAELVGTEGGATVEVEANGSARDLWLTVEDWIAERSLPLVPVSDGARGVVLRPPCA